MKIFLKHKLILHETNLLILHWRMVSMMMNEGEMIFAQILRNYFIALICIKWYINNKTQMFSSPHLQASVHSIINQIVSEKESSQMCSGIRVSQSRHLIGRTYHSYNYSWKSERRRGKICNEIIIPSTLPSLHYYWSFGVIFFHFKTEQNLIFPTVLCHWREGVSENE